MVDASLGSVVARHFHFGTSDAVTGGGVHPIDLGRSVYGKYLPIADEICHPAVSLSGFPAPAHELRRVADELKTIFLV